MENQGHIDEDSDEQNVSNRIKSEPYCTTSSDTSSGIESN